MPVFKAFFAIAKTAKCRIDLFGRLRGDHAAAPSALSQDSINENFASQRSIAITDEDNTDASALCAITSHPSTR